MDGHSHRNMTFEGAATKLPNTKTNANDEVPIAQWDQAPRTRGIRQNQAGTSRGPQDNDIPPPQLILMMPQK